MASRLEHANVSGLLDGEHVAVHSSLPAGCAAYSIFSSRLSAGEPPFAWRPARPGPPVAAAFGWPRKFHAAGDLTGYCRGSPLAAGISRRRGPRSRECDSCLPCSSTRPDHRPDLRCSDRRSSSGRARRSSNVLPGTSRRVGGIQSGTGIRCRPRRSSDRQPLSRSGHRFRAQAQR